MLIRGARVAINAHTACHRDFWISGGRVSFSPVPSVQTPILDLHNFLVMPGLINAHDHLELNLFPKLGNGPYPNSSVWAKEIYRPHEQPVKQHLEIPKPLRLRWGGIKNLISGVTTVAHHNALHPILLDAGFPVRVLKRYGWAHSVQFCPDWEARFRRTPRNYPFVIHTAEGTDDAARREVRTLAIAGALNGSTILVHGVAIDRCDLPLLRRRNTPLVWCPTSNHFTLSRSIDHAVLTSGIPIALGSDSAITADGDLLDELRVARRTIDATRLYRMVTDEPARMFRLPTGFGEISEGGPADLLVMRDSGQTPAITLMENLPELVVVSGRIKLTSMELAKLCPPGILESLQPLEVEGRGRYLVAAEISSLIEETTRVLQEPPRLAGKAIAA